MNYGKQFGISLDYLKLCGTKLSLNKLWFELEQNIGFYINAKESFGIWKKKVKMQCMIVEVKWNMESN